MVQDSLDRADNKRKIYPALVNGKQESVTEDEGLEVFQNIPFAEALRIEGNRQLRRKKLWR